MLGLWLGSDGAALVEGLFFLSRSFLIADFFPFFRKAISNEVYFLLLF